MLELRRSATQGKDVSINSESNKEVNTHVIDNKLKNSAKETMVSVDTNNTVLELNRSATNVKDINNDNNKDNSAKSKEQDNTNHTEYKNNIGAKERMASTIALTKDSGGRKTLLATGTKKLMTMHWTIPIAETKMKKWRKLGMRT